MAEQVREVVSDAALAVVQVVWQTPQAEMSTTASPGPGSGTVTSTSSTAAPFARAMTPLTTCDIQAPSHMNDVVGQIMCDLPHDLNYGYAGRARRDPSR